jgi:tetratricopeptide (TPR) repeat protein
MEYTSFLEDFLINGMTVRLPKMGIIKVLGVDAESFLQGQLTKDVFRLKPEHYQPCSRLCPRGRIKFNAFIKRNASNDFDILVSYEFLESFFEDLNKFIIMEEVVLELKEEPLFVDYKSGTKSLCQEGFISKANLGFDEGSFYVSDEMSDSTFDPGLSLFGMYAFFKQDIGELISNSIVSTVGLDFEKGCFVGQEVASKIENNRGGAVFPFLIFDNSRDFLSDSYGKKVCEYNFFSEFKLKREFRIHESYVGSSILLDFSKLNFFTRIQKSNFLFLRSVNKINDGETEQAKKILNQALEFNSESLDCLEALGVIFGEEKKFDDAHACMDKIIDLSPDHIMARTNKSLFYMREGKIDEAEKEKEISAKLSLGSFQKEIDEKREAKLNNQRAMYAEVLEIDAKDSFALQKYIEISIELFDLNSAREKASYFVEVFPNNSKANLLDVKVKKALGVLKVSDIESAKVVAAKNGDKKTLEEIEKITL